MAKKTLEEFRIEQAQKNVSFFEARSELSHLRMVDRNSYGEEVFQTDQLKEDHKHNHDIFAEMAHLRKHHKAVPTIQVESKDANFPCADRYAPGDPCAEFNRPEYYYDDDHYYPDDDPDEFELEDNSDNLTGESRFEGEDDD